MGVPPAYASLLAGMDLATEKGSEARGPDRGRLPSRGRCLRGRRGGLGARAHEPGEALTRWMQLYVDFIAAKRGLAAALHSGNPAFDTLPAYFDKRLRPALQTLLEAAAAAGEVRAGVAPDDLLRAVVSLCTPAHDVGPAHARRMVALLVDGLRYGVGPSAHTRL